jgi:hypothetical protein
METSQEDALSLLRKWQEEKRLVQAHLSSGGNSGSMILGRIEQIDAEWIKIDGQSRDRLGRQYGLTIALDEVIRFSFEDKRFVEQAERRPQVLESVKQVFDSFLFVELDWCTCTIAVFNLPDELIS